MPHKHIHQTDLGLGNGTIWWFFCAWPKFNPLLCTNKSLIIGPFNKDLQADHGLTKSDYGRLQNQVSVALRDISMWIFTLILPNTLFFTSCYLNHLLNHAIYYHKQYCAKVKYNENTRHKENIHNTHTQVMPIKLYFFILMFWNSVQFCDLHTQLQVFAHSTTDFRSPCTQLQSLSL